MIELAPVFRMMGALAVVLGLLCIALYVVKRYRITLPGAVSGGGGGRVGRARNERRLEVLERLSLDQKRSVLILRADEREYLLTLTGEGAVLLDSGDHATELPDLTGLTARPASLPFAQLLGRVLNQPSAKAETEIEMPRTGTHG